VIYIYDKSPMRFHQDRLVAVTDIEDSIDISRLANGMVQVICNKLCVYLHRSSVYEYPSV
jgi:hypothetical protein